MADHGFKVSKSLNLTPQSSTPTNPTSGDMYYDSSLGSLVYYNASAWASLDSAGSVASAASLTSSAFTPAIVQHALVRITGSVASTLHGMSASFSGKRVVVYNNSTGALVIKHQSVSETTANNRIVTSIANDMNLVAGEVATFLYDSSQSRWLLVSVGSGAGAYAPATTTTVGTVALNAVPVSTSLPEVVVTDASEYAVAQGLTRGSFPSGALNIGTGTNDASITLGKSTTTTTVAGNFAVSGTTSLTGAASLSSTLAVTGATTLTGTLNAHGGIERSSAGAINIGTGTSVNAMTIGSGTNITTLTLGRLSATQALAGNVTVGGTLTATSGATSLANLTATNLTVSGSGNASIGGNLTVAGTASTGALTATTIEASGKLTAQGSIETWATNTTTNALTVSVPVNYTGTAISLLLDSTGTGMNINSSGTGIPLKLTTSGATALSISSGGILLNAGNITIPAANAYKYGSARTHTTFVEASDFIIDDKFTRTVGVSGSSFYNNTTFTAAQAVAHLRLPVGAIITGVVFTYNSSTSVSSFKIYGNNTLRTSLTGQLTPSAGTPGGVIWSTNPVTINLATAASPTDIDLTSYLNSDVWARTVPNSGLLTIGILFPNTVSAAGAFNCTGFKITYTIAEESPLA